MSPETTAPALLVFAGGRSARMHRDKRLACLGDRTLIERVVRACRPLHLPIFVAVAPGDPHLPRLDGCALLFDRRPGEGPLVALADALQWLERPLLVVAADQPALNPEHLSELLDAADRLPRAWAIVGVTGEGEIEPLLGVYRPSILGAIREHLEGGRRGMRAMLEGTAAGSWSAWALPSRRLSTNLNEPRELEEERGRRR